LYCWFVYLDVVRYCAKVTYEVYNKYQIKMFQINAHVIPAKDSENFEKYAGAYATFYINYAEIDGAYELAKYYLTQNEWEIKELEEEYFIIENEDEIDENQMEYYTEAMNEGYSLILNCYETEGEDE
jgi:hypothetical protein